MIYVCELDRENQNRIKRELENFGIHGDDLHRAMNSKIIDLEEIIDINKFEKILDK
ncbi:hypothetical protein IJD44_01405 [bacterium]|nr:hypothetical protein [bacterium]